MLLKVSSPGLSVLLLVVVGLQLAAGLLHLQLPHVVAQVSPDRGLHLPDGSNGAADGVLFEGD